MESILLPEPILKFEGQGYSGVDDLQRLACYPFGHRKVLSTDRFGRNILCDASTREVVIMPAFCKPWLDGCLSLFVPSGGGGEVDHVHVEEDGEVDAKDDECEGGGAGCLYLMARHPRPQEVKRSKTSSGQLSMDFEVLVYGNGRTTSHCKLLPPPPFVLEPVRLSEERPEICSYALICGGSQICVSVSGRGTYTLDTATHTWDKVGDWTLPFHGKVEYVPELKLWFGLSGGVARRRHLAAADLSTMDARYPPQLAAGHGWEEFQPPEEWAEQELKIDREDVQLVSLGSGRFCIVRFFKNWRESDESALHYIVLTGVEVVPRVLANGEVKLEMKPHRSICHHHKTTLGGFVQMF